MMRLSRGCLAALALGNAALAAAPATPGKAKLVILELVPAGGIDPKVASALTEAIANSVSDAGYFDVVSAREVATLVGLERQKQMMGCEEKSSCLTELAGALGARFVMSGSLAKLGDVYQLTLQTLDSGKAQPIGRVTRIAKDLGSLQSILPYALADATATPAPAPPSRIVPYSLMATGGGALILGGVFEIQALLEQQALARELALGQEQPSVLKYASYYRDASSRLQLQQYISIGAAVAGAGLVATGLLLNPADVPVRGGAGPIAATIVPVQGGAFVLGAAAW